MTSWSGRPSSQASRRRSAPEYARRVFGLMDLLQVIVDAGPSAVARFLEFFAGRIANARTRAAYGRAVGQFLGWCEARGLRLREVSPLHVAAYIRTHPGSVPAVKQHLAAIRGVGASCAGRSVAAEAPRRGRRRGCSRSTSQTPSSSSAGRESARERHDGRRHRSLRCGTTALRSASPRTATRGSNNSPGETALDTVLSQVNVRSLPTSDPDGRPRGAPDLVVEILSPSTAKQDRGEKRALYGKHGVTEYWLVDAVAETVQTHRLQGGILVPTRTFDREETLHSPLLTGLELHLGDIFCS